VKFWKKGQTDVEFAKQFKAHLGPVTGLAVSSDGSVCASVSSDKTVKVFDVATFDLIAMLKLSFVPGCVGWIFDHSDAEQKLAVSDAEGPEIFVYDMRSGNSEAVGIAAVHAAPVTAMVYNATYGIVLSADKKGD